jgi:tetratricopeptide (TPR) repeat protein
MSDYLNEADSDAEDGPTSGGDLSPADIELVMARCQEFKVAGNSHFSAGEYDSALQQYTNAVNALKTAHLPKDCLILLNRSATYLALKRYVPALNDANQGDLPPLNKLTCCSYLTFTHNVTAITLDPLNWKGHWRKGVALMSMSKRKFRTQQAIDAFESCYKCDSLPTNKKNDVTIELSKARALLERQDAETPPADLSRCAPS